MAAYIMARRPMGARRPPESLLPPVPPAPSRPSRRSSGPVMNSPVYMDYNATAPVFPAVAAAMGEALTIAGNPSSVHGHGRAARKALEDARERLAAAIGADAQGIIFTSSATEANNLALHGAGRSRILVSAVEHDSVRGVSPSAELVRVH